MRTDRMKHHRAALEHARWEDEIIAEYRARRLSWQILFNTLLSARMSLDKRVRAALYTIEDRRRLRRIQSLKEGSS